MSIHLSVVGTIATAPKLVTSEQRAAFCTFRVACTDRRYDREQAKWIDGETNWLTINVFRSLALHAAESFSTGDRVIVHGRLRVRQWETPEKSGISVEVDADALGHDVRWGVSRFSKRSGATATDAPDPGAGPAESGTTVPGTTAPGITVPDAAAPGAAAPAPSASGTSAGESADSEAADSEAHAKTGTLSGSGSGFSTGTGTDGFTPGLAA